MFNPVELLYPPRCIGCFELVEPGNFVCPTCKRAFERSLNPEENYISGFYCASLYFYTAVVRQCIWNIKYTKSVSTCKRIARLMADEAEKLTLTYPFDIVACVPMTDKDRRARGFNQSEVMAKIIAKRLGLPYKRAYLVKTRQTAPQKSLSAAKRKKNVKGVFRADDEVFGKNVLLIDDVTTTGATLASVMKTLQKAGAKDIIGLTFAKV